MHDVLHDAIQSAQASLGEGVNIAKDFDLSLPSVQGDRDLLVQAFLNLILNAGEACLEISQPSISIKTRFRTLPDGGGYPQARLAVDVIDNGPGVDPDIGASVFSPFVSTKPAGEGLGLSLVSRIAKLHDGGVEYQRYKAHTQFSFFLPV